MNMTKTTWVKPCQKDLINFEILRFKQAIHFIKVLEDIKDGTKIILCDITELVFIPESGYDPEKDGHWLDVYLCYCNREDKIFGWYQSSIKWNF